MSSTAAEFFLFELFLTTNLCSYNIFFGEDGRGYGSKSALEDEIFTGDAQKEDIFLNGITILILILYDLMNRLENAPKLMFLRALFKQNNCLCLLDCLQAAEARYLKQ